MRVATARTKNFPTAFNVERSVYLRCYRFPALSRFVFPGSRYFRESDCHLISLFSLDLLSEF